MQDVQGCIPLVAEGEPGDTCGIPTCITAHHGIAVWVPHRCTRARCPICADKGYIADEASRILRTLQRKIKGRCLKDAGRHKGRTLKVFTFIYSPRDDYAPETEDDIVKERRRMYSRLKSAGALYGYATYHPYRGEHDPEASGPDIRAALDRSRQSGHWHGVALGYWTNPCTEKDYFLSFNCVGSFGPDINLGPLWGYLHKYLRYIINHAAYARQVVNRFGLWPYDADERPKAIPQWRHPDTGQVYVLKRRLFASREERDEEGNWKDPRYVWDDNMGAVETIKEEIGNRLLWHQPIEAPVEILGGDTYRLMSYDAVKVEPDDTRGAAWDAHLISLLSTARKASGGKNNEAPQAVAGSAPGSKP